MEQKMTPHETISALLRLRKEMCSGPHAQAVSVQRKMSERDKVLTAAIKCCGLTDRLYNCLRDLHDHQNGCPLSKYEDTWTQTMATAEKLFKEIEDA